MNLPPALFTVLLYLAAGTMREFVLVLYYRAISGGRRCSASGLAGGLEVYDILVLSYIIKGDWDPWSIAAYVAGVVAGTYLGMRNKETK